MRTLSRPMFNMGGPIKQGIMNGIREPKKDGGKMLLVGQHPKEFRDKSGREKHWYPLAYYGGMALRAAPSIYRGLKAGRMFTPGKLGAWNRFKSMLGPSGRFRTTTSQVPQQGNILSQAQIKAGMIPKMESSKMGIWQALKDPKRFGMFLRENPITALTAATIPGQAIDLGRKHGADVAKGAWTGVKRYADAVIPGDQSDWWKEPIKHDTVPGVPGGGDPGMFFDKTKKVKKELSEAQKNAFAIAQRTKRVQKYLDMMGYDRSKKTAIADALIDASKIVSDRGTLDLKNISRDLINPIIQATSKRLDKPGQIREAVGLMATKAEIEKDLSKETDALKTRALELQIEGAEQTLEASKSFEGGLSKFISDRKGKVDKTTLERISRLLAKEHNETFTKVTEDTDITTLDNGIYMSEGKIIRVTDGVPQQLV